MPRRPAARIALALSALSVCFVTHALAAPAGNLLVNPGFEATLKGHSWMATAWDTSSSGMPTVFFGRDTSIAHGGHYSVSVANVSTLVPMWHNWSQGILVGPEMWNKDLVFSVWTRSNGVQGRGYVLLQAYRDTVGKMTIAWNVPRDTALARLGFTPTSDPYLYLGARREYFSDAETEWVRREVRVFVPPSTNLVFVRCGLFGTGQVLFDDASLTAERALPPAPLPLGVNLLADPGFEGSGDGWEYSLPPYDEMRCDRDTTVVRSGKASIRFTGGLAGVVTTRAGVVQVIGNRGLAGKRIRLTAWVKCDSLKSFAFLKLYCTTIERVEHVGAPQQVGGTTPWTRLQMDMEVPKGTFQIWAWLLYNAPAEGRVYFDDASFEILADASGGPGTGAPAAKSPARGAVRKPAPKAGGTP